MADDSDAQGPDAPDMPGAGTELAEVRAALPSAQIMGDDELRRAWRVASALAASGMFKDARQAEQAMAKIIVGHGLGLGPAQAMTGIHIVEGKPELAAVTLAHFVRSREGTDYKVLTHSDAECSIEFFSDGESRGVSSFTMEDAERAGLIRPKSPWEKFPRNMLYARAMSNGVKWYLPEVTGGIPVYFEGEIDQRELVGGSSDPEPAGIELGPKVEAILARASELGHAGLADRATAEMAVGGMSPKDVEAWCESASAELDRMQATVDELESPEPVQDAEEVCGQPDPHRESVWCEQPTGHDGPHTAAGQTWEPFIAPTEPVPEPETSAGAEPLRERANKLADEAIEARQAGDEARADDLESEAEALNDAAEAASDPAQTGMEV